MNLNEHPLLLVEDDPGLCRLIVDELESEGFSVVREEQLSGALKWLAANQPALVITDLKLPDGHGMDLLGRLIEEYPNEERPGIIVITAFGSVRQAVEALQAGADDFLTKPLDMDHFLISVRKVLENLRLRGELIRFRRLSQDRGFHGMFGKSPAMRSLFDQIRVVARAQGPVLITGESGTGKELVSRALHEESERAGGPFLAVNCAGIPGELLESEFFGHAAGAFTGAHKARRGFLQEADGGTLLLDEVGEMPLALQAKLLRALQDGSFRPVGQDREEKVDVRIIAATHQNLREKVEQGAFREDLYYRLETFNLRVPPLRERGEDGEWLAQRFLQELATAQGREVSGFSPEAMNVLRHYSFPGNVRELYNVVERALTFCRGDQVHLEHLPARLLEEGGGDETQNENRSLEEENRLLAGQMLPSLDELQRRYVKLILHKVGGNKRRAAALLGIGRRTLYRWLEQE